jgi:hypothetical protein
MKYITVILMILCVMSCSNPVDIRTLCVDKTKEKLNNEGNIDTKVDTIFSYKTQYPVSKRYDSVIYVVCKGFNTEQNKVYCYVTASFTYQDSIRQFNLIASGTKEHCIYYVNFPEGEHCPCDHCADIRNYESKHPSYRETGRRECVKGCEHGY